MSFLYSDVGEVSPYLKARQKFYAPEAWDKIVSALKSSVTLYIGNLSFYTDEEQVYSLFLMCGPVRRVIMGINKFTHLPCGFCFVEYYFHKDAMAARDYLNGTKLDDRVIRVDLDPGFEDGRQYGRGLTGGQVRDDRRKEYDEGRGGLPPRQRKRIEQQALESGTLTTPVSSETSIIDNNNNNLGNHTNVDNVNNNSNTVSNNDDNNKNNSPIQTHYTHSSTFSSSESYSRNHYQTRDYHNSNNNNNNLRHSYHKYNHYNNNYNNNNNNNRPSYNDNYSSSSFGHSAPNSSYGNDKYQSYYVPPYKRHRHDG